MYSLFSEGCAEAGRWQDGVGEQVWAPPLLSTRGYGHVSLKLSCSGTELADGRGGWV